MHVPKQERALAMRQYIIDAAADVFERFGYHMATVAQIRERAAVSTGALYFHFSSKAEIASTIFDEYANDAGLHDDGQSGLQAVIDLSHRLDAGLRDDGLLRAAVRLAFDRVACREGGSVPHQLWLHTMEAMLRSAQARGELRAGVEPAAVAQLVVGTLLGQHLIPGLHAGGPDGDRAAARMWDVILPGLAYAHQLPLLRTAPPGDTA